MKQLNILITFLLLTTIVKAQTPQGFNYSAVARDATGKPLANRNVSVQLSILKTSPTGALQYAETHLVNTDGYGLFNLVVGNGAVQSGNISNIQWGSDNHYLKVAIDANGGSNYITMGTTQIMSVPYALNAKKADNGIDRVSANGDTLYLSNGEFFISGSSSNIQPGNSPGQMNYWDGNTWVNINPGQDGQKLTFCNGVPSWNPCANGPHVVGEFFQGGIIAYLLQPGDQGYDPNIQHGIIAAQFDQGSIEWGCSGIEIIGADSLSIGFGNQNSIDIVNACASSNAASICLNFNYNGYNDWYLPSKEELHKLYLFRDQIGGFETFGADYWSSSEDGLNNAWMFDFSAGYPISANKTNYMYVRPIRLF